MSAEKFSKKLDPLPLKNIRIDDSYWNKYTRLVPEVVIPYQWEILNNRVPDTAQSHCCPLPAPTAHSDDRVPGTAQSHCLENFRIAAGEAQGERLGVVFQDSDVAKWLEAVAYSLAVNPNPELERTADEVIALIGRAQCEDGYLNTYFTLRPGVRRWENLMEGHELYTAGHLIEAAVAYREATGKDEFLKIMCRFADLICDTFGAEEGRIHGYPGHQEIELALVKLYRATGRTRYLSMARYFIDERGKSPNYFLEEQRRPDFQQIFSEFADYDPCYSQSDKPVLEQDCAEGHAVRATYMYCAMADLAYEYQDGELFAACERLWKSIVEKRMYLTGSIGSSIHLERFTTDYDLPNDSNYSETCASIGLALFGLRMANITRDASYIDVAERALYNNIRAGISLNGDRYFYVNPLEVWPDVCLPHTSKEAVKPVRQKWFDVACCPTNVARTLSSLGQYLYGQEENSLYIHLFIQNETSILIGGHTVQVSMKTDFPRTGRVTLQVSGADADFKLCLRIPNYAEHPVVTRNGEKAEFQMERGYAVLDGNWCSADEVILSFEMRAHFVRANPQVRSDSGKVAVVRGPEVFCLEQTDNGANLAAVSVSQSAPLNYYWDDSLFHGCSVIEFVGKRMLEVDWKDGELYKETCPQYRSVLLKAIPYAYWCNREPGEMLVWMRCPD